MELKKRLPESEAEIMLAIWEMGGSVTADEIMPRLQKNWGKTTLLNLLSTLDVDYDGEIRYNDIDYRQILSELRRNIVSFVLQENQFISYLNVSDNLILSS